jgi:hypothetical protein
MNLAPLKKIYRAPIPGILAFIVVFLWQGLGHTAMVGLEWLFGHEYVYHIAVVIGIVGAAVTWIGRNKSEAAATFWGFTGGSLIWLSWVEFSFHFYARHLGVQGIGSTEPEYLVMQSSVGVMFATLVFFYFNKETRCNAFMWMHRNLHMNPGDPLPSKGRNISSIVAMETIYVTWFFYLTLLILYDQAWAGDQHPATYVAFVIFFVWSIYLLQRLLRFQRMAPALRYAIPTAIISYNCWEILERWNIIGDFWINPGKYAFELGAVLFGLILAVVLSVLSPARQPVES